MKIRDKKLDTLFRNFKTNNELAAISPEAYKKQADESEKELIKYLNGILTNKLKHK
jgi:hypothetical protein